MIRFWWLLLFFPLYIYMWTDAAQVGFGHDLKCIESAAACLSRYYKSFSRMLCWVVLYCILILVRTKLILVGWIPCPFRVGYFCIVDWCRNESCLSSTATWNWAHTHTLCTIPYHSSVGSYPFRLVPAPYELVRPMATLLSNELFFWFVA